MASIESSVFAAQFSDLFKDFVKQQTKFQERIEKTFDNIAKSVDANKKSETVKRDFLSKEDQKYREGRPDADKVQKKEPRKVVQDILPVSIQDISDKAAKKLDDDDTVTNVTTNNMGGGGFDWMKLLGPLLGLGIGGLGFALNEIGMDTTLVSRLFQGTNVAGKILQQLKLGKHLDKIKAVFSKSKIVTTLFSKLGSAKVILKRLPLVGLLFSFGEAVTKLKTGNVEQIFSGFLDILGGIAYMFPGPGTAVGIGIDLINYWYENKLAEDALEGKPQAQNWGELWTKIKGYIYESSFIQYFVKLGEGAKKLFDEPNMLNLIELLEHMIGNNPVLVFLKSIDEGIGSMLGLEDEEGNAQSLTGWMGNWVNEKIIEPISDFFEWVGGLIFGAFNKIKDFATQKVEEAYEAVVTKPVEDLTGVSAMEAQAEGEAAVGEMGLTLYRKLRNRALEAGATNAELKELVQGIGTDEEGMRERANKIREWLNANEKKDESDLPEVKDEMGNELVPDTDFERNTNIPLGDFSVSGGEVNAIVRGNKYQQFSNDDNIIGFKDGEALAEGIKELISVGQQQLEILAMYLEKSGAGGNVVAPSTTNNYTYNVESSVSAFRKAVN
jgi:hypothetical protein